MNDDQRRRGKRSRRDEEEAWLPDLDRLDDGVRQRVLSAAVTGSRRRELEQQASRQQRRYARLAAAAIVVVAAGGGMWVMTESGDSSRNAVEGPDGVSPSVSHVTTDPGPDATASDPCAGMEPPISADSDAAGAPQSAGGDVDAGVPDSSMAEDGRDAVDDGAPDAAGADDEWADTEEVDDHHQSAPECIGLAEYLDTTVNRDCVTVQVAMALAEEFLESADAAEWAIEDSASGDQDPDTVICATASVDSESRTITIGRSSP